ncbi:MULTISPECIES: hypothetical protein [Zobellia]|uniref:hypothetical protein n=1 Tax=Zobellia TaxID=112040 RepID=UPI00188BA64C|nr:MULTISPECIES: hypothetical protein [Zobellia]WKX76177.1 hypothetical protein Q5W13_21840 [Zobellia laminariae]
MANKQLEVSDYGLYLSSPDRMNSFLKSEKIKSKKLLSFFQKNHDKYLKSIEEGAWLPILPIDSIEYIVQVNKALSEDWIEIYKIEGFNIEVGNDNSLWIGSLSNLHNWNPKDYPKDKDFNSYETLDGQKCYGSHRFDIPKGKYLINIKAYKHKKQLEYPQANFGFSFELESVNQFDGYKDPREDEKYSFNVAQM